MRKHSWLVWLVMLGCIFLLSACEEGSPSEAVTVTASAPSGALPAWMKVYFTNPDPPDQVNDGIDRYAVEAINQAKKQIDVTSFDFNLPSVTDALVQASQRGVAVRVVVDGENGKQDLDANQSPTGKAYDAVKVLKKAKIPVVDGGRSNGLMHDKMIIIDGKLLLVGSWNMSYNDTFRNNNNLLEITNPDLVANYQAKFNEMFESQLFGAKSEVGALKNHLNIAGVPVENYFSPPDEVMAKLVEYVNGAKQSVKFMAFTYTHKDLAQAMLDRAKAGVSVAGVFENRGASQGAMPQLYCAGLPIRIDGNKYTMHHKVIIIDDKTVITGSFNFTQSADNANDDNILVIHNPDVAALYLQEYERVYGLGKEPDKAETCP